MATTELTPTRAGRGGERFLRLAEAGVARIAALWRAARNRRTVAVLLDWDERMLRDIGLTPNDVRSALATPGSRDPSCQLRELSSERRSAVRAAARERVVRRRFAGLEI